MTRGQAKKLSPAIAHFANGGNLWRYNNRLKKWESQTTVEQLNKESNIIEDKHFESRKAFALGEEIEKRIKYQDDTNGQWDVAHFKQTNWLDTNDKLRRREMIINIIAIIFLIAVFCGLCIIKV